MNANARYHDRRHAGRVLASVLMDHELGENPLVLALPRGGVPVAFEVAEALAAPLDVLIVRKIGLPGQPEFAMGSLASGGIRLLNEQLIDEAGITDQQVEQASQVEWRELRRRDELYRPGRPPLDFSGREVIVVDDGLATGFSLRAAVETLRRGGAARVTVAVPVGARDSCEMLAREVDQLVCPMQPRDFHSVGEWYDDFDATTDAEVAHCLERASVQPHFPQGRDRR
jgi:predicted phosphoribosyltransferase